MWYNPIQGRKHHENWIVLVSESGQKLANKNTHYVKDHYAKNPNGLMILFVLFFVVLWSEKKKTTTTQSQSNNHIDAYK
jgi:hypothetical protein